jgi:hypothetical protein
MSPAIPRHGQPARVDAATWWPRMGYSPLDPARSANDTLGPETQVSDDEMDTQHPPLTQDEAALLHDCLMADQHDQGYMAGYLDAWRWGAICGACGVSALVACALALGSYLGAL